MDKLTEFLRSFVSSHLRRFESNAQFPVIEFLALLFKYTFQQTRTESFFSCLETWGVCIDLISASVAANVSNPLQSLSLFSTWYLFI